MQPSVSVVINTYNRASFLAQTINSFRYLDYKNFEVIVVAGPSTDKTDQVLQQFAAEIRVERCPDTNLSMSRNIGIRAAAGDIVVFIDDDGIPEPEWLTRLVTAYEDPQVGGAGGFVFNHTGYEYQGQYMISDRLGNSVSQASLPPIHNSPQAGGFQYPSLIGVNSSFRRTALLEIGGFDEFFMYYLDETDVCLRLVDRGYKIKVIPDAYVHHKGAPSAIRNYFMYARSQTYFALVNNRGKIAEADILRGIEPAINQFRGWVHGAQQQGLINSEQAQGLLGRIDQGYQEGLTTARSGRPRKFLDPAQSAQLPERFKKFPVMHKPTNPLVVCLFSIQFPPGPVGGIGRWTYELSRELASQGHTVHVITRSKQQANSVEFEEGVWVHRLVPVTTPVPSPIPVPPWIWAWAHAAAKEVHRINTHHQVDCVQAPIYDLEGLGLLGDQSIPLITTLQTTFKTMTESHGEWQRDPQFWNGVVLPMVSGEEYMLSRSPQILSISNGATQMVNSSYGLTLPPEKVTVVPLGIRDISKHFRSTRSDQNTMVLFVGRLEPRKGVDVLLQVIPGLAQQFPNARFVLAGDSSYKPPGGKTFQELFLAQHQGQAVLNQVAFLGQVSDEQLYQLYCDCDIFVAPSRFESFGLIFIEAMMFGKPVIGCRAGGMKDVIREGETGLLAEPGDAKTLNLALSTLIRDKDLRTRLGKTARSVFEREYTAQVMANRSAELYRRVSKRKLASMTNLRPELLLG